MPLGLPWPLPPPLLLGALLLPLARLAALHTMPLPQQISMKSLEGFSCCQQRDHSEACHSLYNRESAMTSGHQARIEHEGLTAPALVLASVSQSRDTSRVQHSTIGQTKVALACGSSLLPVQLEQLQARLLVYTIMSFARESGESREAFCTPGR